MMSSLGLRLSLSLKLSLRLCLRLSLWLEKFFYDSKMRSIDSPPRKTPKKKFFGENSNLLHFRFNTPTTFPESGKRFHASGMHAIDSPHKITPIGVVFRKYFLVQIHA